MKVLIATSDATSYILPAMEHLWDKYLPEFKDVEVLGYSLFPGLELGIFKTVSLAQKQNNINEWCGRLHDYITTIPDEFVIFGLDDLLPVRSMDYAFYNYGLQLMESDKSIGRYELGVGHCWHTNTKELNTFFYEYGSKSLYRISTQWSIWRREYLLKYLKHGWSAWDFEIEGSKIAVNDGHKVIASNLEYALHWVHSAISGKYPGKINVKDIKKDDIEEMIHAGILKRETLQLGIEIDSPAYER
jgi:hypothetical protein